MASDSILTSVNTQMIAHVLTQLPENVYNLFVTSQSVSLTECNQGIHNQCRMTQLLCKKGYADDSKQWTAVCRKKEEWLKDNEVTCYVTSTIKLYEFYQPNKTRNIVEKNFKSPAEFHETASQRLDIKGLLSPLP